MEIKKIRLSNVGRFTDLEVAFAPTESHPCRVTVFVGNNGAGKTTILKSLATSLSWLVAKIRTQSGKGNPISEGAISSETSTAAIEVSVDVICPTAKQPLQHFSWTLTRSRRARTPTSSSKLSDASRLAEGYRDYLTDIDQTVSLPLIAYYPVERSVLEIPLGSQTRRTYDQFDGYDNSLNRGVDFGRFFEWFRDREDIENEKLGSTILLNDLPELASLPADALLQHLKNAYASSRDPQLTAVRSAISIFMPGFDHLRVQRKPRLQMSIDKAGKTLNVEQLSQGEKSMMALVGDIARRLAIMNPSLENPLEGIGIVMIDEVDLHLHPQWQRRLVRQLTETFRNCQFILTTHSPLVISDSKDILCYVLDDGELEERNGLYGMDANQVLLSIMDTDVRNSEVQDRLDLLLELVQDKRLAEAKMLYKTLSQELPEGHIELAKAALLIRKLELRGA